MAGKEIFSSFNKSGISSIADSQPLAAIFWGQTKQGRMIIELGGSTEKLVFSNFELTADEETFRKQGPPIFISTRITSYLPQFQSTIDTYLSLADLKVIMDGLKEIWYKNTAKFDFENVDFNIEFSTTINRQGVVTIIGHYFNSNKSADLHFEFEFDQSYLRLTIEQLREVIGHFSERLTK